MDKKDRILFAIFGVLGALAAVAHAALYMMND